MIRYCVELRPSKKLVRRLFADECKRHVQVQHDLKFPLLAWCSDQLVAHHVVPVLPPGALKKNRQKVRVILQSATIEDWSYIYEEPVKSCCHRHSVTFKFTYSARPMTQIVECKARQSHWREHTAQQHAPKQANHPADGLVGDEHGHLAEVGADLLQLFIRCWLVGEGVHVFLLPRLIEIDLLRGLLPLMVMVVVMVLAPL